MIPSKMTQLEPTLPKFDPKILEKRQTDNLRDMGHLTGPTSRVAGPKKRKKGRQREMNKDVW